MEKESDQAACNGDQHEQDAVEMDEEAAAKEKLTSSADPSKVKFTTVSLDGYDGKNGEAKVDIQVVQASVGMGKEELMKYANEPFWVRLRMSLFVLFWVAWLAMLVGAIVIILLAPRCPPAPHLSWYQKSAMYQADVKTFMDSDGDGVGDLKGLISKLDYFKMQNIGTLMLSAFFTTSTDGGIVDHKEVDVKYGTLEDFEQLVSEMQKKDIKLVIDFNPNHSSDEHPWFIASAQREGPYKDFYVWADSPTEDQNTPPNNWLNVDGGSAWTWNEQRGQFYLHTFGSNQPDLNLRSEQVRNELKEILRLWLNKGVDGFRVVAASHLVEGEDLRDEPLVTNKSVDNRKYNDINHIFTVDQPENLGLFAEWREILTNFTISSGIQKILLAEVSGTVNKSILYYGNETSKLAEFPINTILTELNINSSGHDVKHSLDAWLDVLPKFAWPSWLLGNEHTRRLATRMGPDLVDGIHMVAFMSKGTPLTYYGDELGMTDDISPISLRGRTVPDIQRISDELIMPWSNGTFGGFTNGTSQLFLTSEYEEINVKMEEGDKQSHLNIYRKLLALRDQAAIKFGMQEYPLVTDNIFSMIRVRKGTPGYLLAINLGNNSTTVDFSKTNTHLPEQARVEIRSHNLRDGTLAKGENPKVYLNNIPLDPKQSVVFSFIPKFED